MAPLSSDVHFLLNLAGEKSVQGRKELIALISDLVFATNTVISERERALITDLLRKLVEEVAAPIRRALAERLAETAIAPHEVLASLASDGGEVARPILSRIGRLLDTDLIETIRHRSLEHQLASAMRRTAGDPAADALAWGDGADVIETLLKDQRASIAEATLAYLDHQSKTLDSFQEPILPRSHLSAKLARRMHYWVSASLRQHIVDHHDVAVERLDEAIEAVAEETTIDLDRSARRPASELAGRLAEAALITPKLLVQSLRQGEVALFEALLVQLSGLRLNLVRRLLFEPGGEGMAIVCRALDFGKPTFAAILVLGWKARPNAWATEARALTNALALFDRIGAGAARAVVAHWRRAPEFLYAVKQIQEAAGAGRILNAAD